MYDYVDGKVDWMAYGLEVEGEDGPFVGQMVRPVRTCRWDQTVAEVRSELSAVRSADHGGHEGHDHEGHDHEGHDHEGHDHEGHVGRGDLGQRAAVVLGPGDLAIGALGQDALAEAAASDIVLDVMRPVPATVRPSVTVGSLMESKDPRAIVTTSDGRLLGQVDAGDTSEGDEPHDPRVAEILAEVRLRFGSEDPSEEELRIFLHERLVAEGRTAEEADQFLDQMNDPDAD